MGPVYDLCGLRLIDLSKTLDPATESRRCHLIRYNAGGPIPDFHNALDLTSHLGTHCECPYHHFEQGASVGDLPLTTFMGRALYVVLDLPENHQITGEDLEKAFTVSNVLEATARIYLCIRAMGGRYCPISEDDITAMQYFVRHSYGQQ